MTPIPSSLRAGALAVGGAAVAGTLTAVLLASGTGMADATATGPALAPVAGPAGGLGLVGNAPPVPSRTGPAGCPSGAVPRVTLTGATFAPELTGGTSFVKGRYTITLVGTVDDETGAGIDIRGLRLTLGGKPWTARPTVATRVAPQTSARLVVRGTYTATRTERVDLRTSLGWRWSDHALTHCGTKGLVDDD